MEFTERQELALIEINQFEKTILGKGIIIFRDKKFDFDNDESYKFHTTTAIKFAGRVANAFNQWKRAYSLYQRTKLELKEFLTFFYLPKEVYENIDYVLSAIRELPKKEELFGVRVLYAFIMIQERVKEILEIYDDIAKTFQLVQTTGGAIVSIKDRYNDIKNKLNNIIEENFLKTLIFSGAIGLIHSQNKYNIARFFYCLYHYHHKSKNKTNIDLLTREYRNIMEWKTLFEEICKVLSMEDVFNSYKNTAFSFDNKTQNIYKKYIEPFVQ